MSVTFSMDAPSGARLEGDSDADWGRYLSAKEAEGEFNVANGNAHYILSEILKIENCEMWGSMSGEELAFRLSHVVSEDVDGGFRPSHQDGNVIDCGRSFSQCERYLASLVKLAKVAAERGVGIIWG